MAPRSWDSRSCAGDWASGERNWIDRGVLSTFLNRVDKFLLTALLFEYISRFVTSRNASELKRPDSETNLSLQYPMRLPRALLNLTASFAKLCSLHLPMFPYMPIM